MGAFVLMIKEMIRKDLIRYLLILIVVLFACSAAAFKLFEAEPWINYGQQGNYGQGTAYLSDENYPNWAVMNDDYGSCDVQFHLWTRTFYLLLEGSLTANGLFGCVATSNKPVQGLVLMYLFYIITTILLLNMLIAMMSQSYEQTLETARANYHLRFAQTVLEYKALPPTPPPLYALSLPYEIYTIANGGWKEILFLMKKVCRKKRTKDEEHLDIDNRGTEGADDARRDHDLASRNLSRNIDKMEAFIKKRTARLGKDEKLERINELSRDVSEIRKMLQREMDPDEYEREHTMPR